MSLFTDQAPAPPAPTRSLFPHVGAHLLGDASLSALVTSDGTGYVSFEGVDLTRFRGDALADTDGLLVYLRDLDTGRVWSAGRQPVGGQRAGSAGLTANEATSEWTDDSLTVKTIWTVEEGVFVGRVHIYNLSGRTRRIELTTYAEVALNSRAADAGHPAFSKLFVQTERVPDQPVLVAKRRPRSPDEVPLWMAHAMFGADADVSHETDRMRFIGRGRDVHAPAALDAGAELSGTVGAVLDPVVSLRRTVEVAHGTTEVVTVGLTGGRSRDAVLTQVQSVVEGQEAPAREPFQPERGHVWAHGLLGALVYGTPEYRAPLHDLGTLTPGDWSLDRFGLSPARPLVLVRVASSSGQAALNELAVAHRFWADRGLAVSLVALADGAEVDADETVTVLHAADLSADELAFLNAAAHVYADDQTPRMAEPERDPSARDRYTMPSANGRNGQADSEHQLDASGLREFNGIGGFSPDGSEYVIHLTPGPDGRLVRPPLPWVNVIANPSIGFIVSETGSASTWSANSRLNRLTPWANDPVSDPFGEALYVREDPVEGDGIGADFWSPTGGPAPAPGPIEIRHGFGGSTWRAERNGLAQTVTQFVAREDAVRFTRVELTNTSDRPRRVSVVSAARLVLGALAEGSQRFVVTERDGDAILAQNPTAGEFAERVAVVGAVAPEGAKVSLTADRAAFLGGKSLAEPRALTNGRQLDGATGTGLDPAAACHVSLDLTAGETQEVTFLLGQGADRAEAIELRGRYASSKDVQTAYELAMGFWRDLTQTLQIETPEPALDLMVNGWLPYQNLSCRIWGRSAYSQSGGAYGYRDQLQDASSLSMIRPELTREQILRHASHQFPEGDVLHWWHPPLSKGIRTRFSDDLLWLPLLTSHYVEMTGDAAVWDELTPFVDARQLEPGEDEAFLIPERLEQTATVYEHACLAIDRSLAVGANGLPLMGTGDWNDGMNRVGREGKGESVWMGFFLYDILGRMAPLAEARGDAEHAIRYAEHREHLYKVLNNVGWDGDWYRRATYDNGAWLGSKQSDECQIDTLAQAWSVLSGAAPPARAAQALDAMERQLVDEDAGLIRLLTPAFDVTPHDPGYIKGYVPGVRENGGQYTHAALWAVRALAKAGRSERAAPLLAMLSPVSHGDSPETVETYKAEPYVVAADVYGVEPHVGRGGWTWYTGSAGWMWRVAVESILGLTVENGTTLVLRPCIPDGWPGFSVRYRVPDGSAVLRIEVSRGELAAALDGESVAAADGGVRIPLPRDGKEHVLRLAIPMSA
ncbi:MAG: hypothetical protein Rubg2KO_28600 [Rubricoccaceae bacterium]